MPVTRAPRKTRSRLLASSAGRGWLPARSHRKVSAIASPLPKLSWRTKLSFVLLDPKGAGPAYTRDLRKLTRPEEILEATRAAIALPREPGKPCSSWLRFPGHGDFLRVTVPVDSRLEAKAREWTRSEDKELRREGAKALMFYRSDANASILKGLLADPNFWNATTEERGVVHHFRWYWVREEAYGVLDSWGYDLPRPVFKEDQPAGPDR